MGPLPWSTLPNLILPSRSKFSIKTLTGKKTWRLTSLLLCLTSLCWGLNYSCPNEVSVTGKIPLRRLGGIVEDFSVALCKRHLVRRTSFSARFITSCNLQSLHFVRQVKNNNNKGAVGLPSLWLNQRDGPHWDFFWGVRVLSVEVLHVLTQHLQTSIQAFSYDAWLTCSTAWSVSDQMWPCSERFWFNSLFYLCAYWCLRNRLYPVYGGVGGRALTRSNVSTKWANLYVQPCSSAFYPLGCLGVGRPHSDGAACQVTLIRLKA